MSHRPVCVKCQVEMQAEKNGVGLLDMASFGPYEIWEADLYQCPECKYQIVVGFGQEGIEHYNTELFQLNINRHTKNSTLIKSWDFPSSKPVSAQLPKKKVCTECYQGAILYQPPELGLKPLAMFPERIIENTEECEVHGWYSSDIWQELLRWIET